MGSLRAPDAPGLGEWHMHCHVLNHMMDGMMGSLLIVQGGELFSGLPSGEPCAVHAAPATVVVKNFAFTPAVLAVAPGTMVTFDFQENDHTVETPAGGAVGGANPITINNGVGPFDAVTPLGPKMVTVTGSSGGTINYRCGIHGAGMSGTIQII